jgi:ribosome-associated protein
MAKKPVQKAAVKKSIKTAAKKIQSSSKRSSKSVKGGATKVKKKPVLTEKEKAFRMANVIENSERKKKTTVKRPKKTSSEKETTSLLDAVVEGMRERKAKNIVILNLENIENRVTDYFVICDADSNTHVNSIADSVTDTVEKLTKERAYHVEGTQNGEWILIDYINVVAHVFQREMREHYNIEGLWGDAEITEIND